MPVGQQHHGGIAVAVPVGLGRLRQALATSASVRYSRVRNSAFGRRSGVATVRFYSGWRYQFEVRLCHGFPRSCPINCSNNSSFTNSQQGKFQTKQRPRRSFGGVRRGRAGQRSVVETERRPGLAMPVLSACSCDRMAARCRVRQRPPAGCWGLIVPAAARAASKSRLRGGRTRKENAETGRTFRQARPRRRLMRDIGEAAQAAAHPEKNGRPGVKCRLRSASSGNECRRRNLVTTGCQRPQRIR